MNLRSKIVILAASFVLAEAGWRGVQALFHPDPSSFAPPPAQGDADMAQTVKKSREEWKKTLPADTFRVMIACGTEPPWSGKYNDFWEAGDYHCAACGALLFNSQTKYEHGTGWPSFFETAAPNALLYLEDRSAGMVRTEVRCAACDGHLGHVFDDGPPPTGRHYCINSAALEFRKSPAEAGAKKTETAIFAAGCFWGVEEKFGQLPGVLETEAGYTGGRTVNPTYEQVCSGVTGHAEAVRVVFDPARISYTDLVRAFFSFHDPTQKNRQGPDVGTQYRSAIFTRSEEQRKQAVAVKAEVEASGRFRRDVVTEISPAEAFTRAEEYHQKYNLKNKRSCIF